MKYVYLQSSLHNDSTLKRKAETLFNAIGEKIGVEFKDASLGELSKEPFSILYIATGGTAGLFKDSLKFLKEPIILVTSGTDNSLSASMEMVTYLKNNRLKGQLLYGTSDEIAGKLDKIAKAIRTKDSLNGMRLGLFGKPSDWLITTDADYDKIKEKLGIEVVDIEMEELLEEIAKEEYIENETTRLLLTQNFDKEQIEGALYIYGAFKRLVNKYNLQGFSVRCFDLLTSVKNTGCLGLAILNQEGIYSGCEGDLPSLISMAILGEISNQPVFQCNPSRINKSENEIIFALCTLPLNMPTSYKLDTHFESGIGVAITGEIPQERATIFKSTNMLDRKFLSGCVIKKNLHERNLCRSQILVNCDEGIDNFLGTPVGNHYLITLGDYTGYLEEFFSLI